MNINIKNILLYTISIVIIFILIWNVNDLFFGIAMALLMDHIIEIFEDSGFNKYLSILLTIFIIIAGVLFILLNLLPLLYNNFLSIMDYFQSMITKNPDYFRWKIFSNEINGLPLIEKLLHIFDNYKNNSLTQWNSINSFQEIINNIGYYWNQFSSIINIILGFLSTIFIARGLFNTLLIQYPQKNYIDIFIKCRNKIKKFLYHQLIIAGFNGLFFSFIINFFAVKGAFSMGVMVFLSSFFITSFGSLIGIMITIIMMIVQQYNSLSITIATIFCIIPYIIENYILTPILICEELEINYLILLMSLLVTTKIFGFKYLIFTIPFIIIGKMMIRIFNIKNK